MFTGSAELYDLIDTKFTDYTTQASRLNRKVKRSHPDAASLLIIPCGTGELARILAADYGYRVNGIDDCPDMIERAADKNPNGSFHHCDLFGYEMHNRYDAVILLSGAFGSVENSRQLFNLLCCCKNHLSENGILILEPWKAPPEWHNGHMQMTTVEDPALSITRISYYENNLGNSHIHHEYIVLSSEGLLEPTEIRQLHCFSPEELTVCFENTGLQLETTPGSPDLRNYLVAKPDETFTFRQRDQLRQNIELSEAI